MKQDTADSNSNMESKRTRHKHHSHIFSRFFRRYWKRSSSVEASEAETSHSHPSTSEQYKERHYCLIHNTNSTFTIQESNSNYLLSEMHSQDSCGFGSTNSFPKRPQIGLIIKDSEPVIPKVDDARILFSATTATCLMDSDTHITKEKIIISHYGPDYTSKLITLKNMASQVPSKNTDVNGLFKDSIIDDSIGGKTISEQEIKISPPQETLDFTEANLASNIDKRYGGQYFTVEQLPEFCEQLRHLVEMIRNIQSYATLTGEYPSALEKRLQREAREVVALAAEVRNARDSIERARTQRRAVRVQRKEIVGELAALREEEIREMENTVRVADRKLYKSWENLKDATEIKAFDGLLSEIKEKQNALENLNRLIDNHCTMLRLLPTSPSHTPRSSVPALKTSGMLDKHPRTRYYPRRKSLKRKWREREIPSHSVPVSNEPSIHSNREPIQNQNMNSTVANHRSVNSVISNHSPRNSINFNSMTVPYELVSQSGIPANMLPSMGSNSNHNLTLNLTMVPFRYGRRPQVVRNNTDSDQNIEDVVFTSIHDQ